MQILRSAHVILLQMKPKTSNMTDDSSAGLGWAMLRNSERLEWARTESGHCSETAVDEIRESYSNMVERWAMVLMVTFVLESLYLSDTESGRDARLAWSTAEGSKTKEINSAGTTKTWSLNQKSCKLRCSRI